MRLVGRWKRLFIGTVSDIGTTAILLHHGNHAFLAKGRFGTTTWAEMVVLSQGRLTHFIEKREKIPEKKCSQGFIL
jgi:hypothetical protein